MSLLKQLLLVAAMLVLVAAQDLVESSSTRSVEEGRRKKRFYKFFYKALGPILSTLATVVLVKAKIVLVGLFLAGIYFFGHKIFPGGFFGSSIISETPPPFIESSPYTSYHATGHEIISSYPGPEPFTSFDHSSSSYGSPASSYGPPSNAYLPPTSDSSYSKYSGKRRKRDVDVGRQQTPGADELEDDEMYWTDTLTDMTFRFLGVNRRVCRKRFVCEFDFQARRNPILLFVTRAIGRDVFHNYRDVGDEKPASYKDCGRIYEECKVPKRKKFARRPIRPLTSQQQQFPLSTAAGDDDMQENEIDSSRSTVETTAMPTISPVRSKLILLPKHPNRFRRN